MPCSLPRAHSYIICTTSRVRLLNETNAAEVSGWPRYLGTSFQKWWWLMVCVSFYATVCLFYFVCLRSKLHYKFKWYRYILEENSWPTTRSFLCPLMFSYYISIGFRYKHTKPLTPIMFRDYSFEHCKLASTVNLWHWYKSEQANENEAFLQFYTNASELNAVLTIHELQLHVFFY